MSKKKLGLNTLKPAAGAVKNVRRVGRGIGCGRGKTSGRGHKGQSARAGGFHRIGFEGGQSPMQRRLPKFGFKSKQAVYVAQIRLGDLNKIKEEEITLDTLRAAKLISTEIQRVRVINTGKIEKPFRFSGVHVTKGARVAIEAAGGAVKESAS